VDKELANVNASVKVLTMDLQQLLLCPKSFASGVYCKSSDEQQAVIVNSPSYNEVRKQLCRHRTAQNIPVPNPLGILDELKLTLRGRQVLEDDSNRGEKFLLYSGDEGRLLVFCAETELKLLHQSEYIICDGTFEMAPDSSYQLYTLHGFCKGESPN
jgi:hypothetical protein